MTEVGRKPPVVLFVSHTGDWGGGAEVVLQQMVQSTASFGFEPWLVSPPGTLATRLAGDCRRSYTIELPQLRRSRNPLVILLLLSTWLVALIRLTVLVRRFTPDLLHANSGTAALSMCPVALLCRVPLIWQQGDIVPNRLVNRLALRPCAAGCASIIACSRAVRQSLLQLDIPSRKVHIIYPTFRSEFERPGSDRNRARRVLGLPAQRAVLTIVGRLVARKGHFVLLAALPLLCEEGIDAQVVFVGDPPQEPGGSTEHLTYRASLERLAAEPQRAGRVTFLGRRDDIKTVLEATDVLVMPSFNEPLGIVMLEAFAAGVPVVASDSGGPLEVIRHGETGLLVPAGDPAALAGALTLLLHDASLRQTLIDQAHADVTRRFSPAGAAARLREQYATALATRGHPLPQAVPLGTRVQ